jgi:predicted nucleic acid-binding protein
MTSSVLGDPLPELVADASAVISLLASGVARPVLESLPVRLRVVKQVSRELATGQQKGWDTSALLGTLVQSKLAEIVGLDDASHDCFESLVIGSAADTLDDGEAATIAYARSSGVAAVIDEKKARRICAARFPGLVVHTTVALLTSAHVTRVLGEAAVADAVFNALRTGRMRVPAADHQRVVAIIGTDRARLCLSLPEHVRSPAAKRLTG